MEVANKENFMKKMELLPEYRQQEVLDFLEFVFERFLNEIETANKNQTEKDENFTVSKELKEFLEYRLEQAELNRDKAISSEEYDEKIREKYNWQ